MNQYTELYAWIRHSFGNESFTIEAFRSVFPTSQAPKVIHDLIQQGYVQRVSRGVYRAVEPKEWIASIITKGSAWKKIIKSAQRKYAYCDSTAVSIWTEGYYWTGFTKGFRPIHIKVLKKDISYWREFFEGHAARYAMAEENRTLFGFVYIIHPEQDFDAVEKNGDKVIPLEEVVRFCLEHEMAYQPALEYLDEHYGIGYRSRAFVRLLSQPESESKSR
jgi:hypothetical protein